MWTSVECAPSCCGRLMDGNSLRSRLSRSASQRPSHRHDPKLNGPGARGGMLALVSDDVLSVVPSDPHWQPDPATGHHVAQLVKSLSLVDGDGGWCEVDWHDDVALVDCGGNLARIGCPSCGRQLDDEWWRDLLEARHTSGSGLADLAVVVPCCGAATTSERTTDPPRRRRAVARTHATSRVPCGSVAVNRRTQKVVLAHAELLRTVPVTYISRCVPRCRRVGLGSRSVV